MDSVNSKVLVVDDAKPLVATLATILEDEGYLVLTASDGQDGLSRAVINPPDVILMDVNMPVMDGWTACRLLKQHQETFNIPVVLMSAEAMESATLAQLGVEYFLHKPFDLEDLLCCIRKYTNAQSSRN